MITAVADPGTSPRPEAPPDVEEKAVNVAAPWRVRALALAVDVLPGTAVAATMAVVWSTVPLGSRWWWVCVVIGGLAILLTAGNRLLLPAVTGWSLGRAAMGIEVVRSGDGFTGPVGGWRLLLRDLAHLVDTASVFVGWLWPLWDRRGRTFADLLVGTEVRRAELRRVPRNVPGLAALVSLIAALLCIVGAAVSYLVVYQYGQASQKARAQIAARGPKMVAQILTYHPDTLQADFERARSLVTAGYRDQLVAQQQVVEKSKPVGSDYWVTNSSVLSASPHRATMLLFLQGQRNSEKEQRSMTATVRVHFADSDAQWRVDDISVLTKPVPAEEGN